MITKDDYDRLVEVHNNLQEALDEIEQILKSADRNLYEQWKAYGKQVTAEYVSMGPNLPDIVENLAIDVIDEDEVDHEDTDIENQP